MNKSNEFNKTRYSILSLALKNCFKQKFRSVVIFLLIILSSVAIMLSYMLMNGMSTGLETTAQRLGADIIIVPEDYIDTVEGALFEGKPCTSYFDAKMLKRISHAEEKYIEKISSQLYIATLKNASCCSNSIQLIAIDEKTDFTIRPWMKESGITDITDNEIIFGSNVNVKKGDTVKYYGKKFVVAGVLDKSGMGYDNSAFITNEAAYRIADAKDCAVKFSFGSEKPAISMILINLKAGTDIGEMVNLLNSKYRQSGLTVYRTSNLLSGYGKNVKNFSIFGRIMAVMTTLLSLTALFATVTIATKQRKREFGCMLTIGIGKDQIFWMIICELITIATTATIAGGGLVWICMRLFDTAIETLVKVPFKLPSEIEIIQMAVFLIGLNLAECVAALAYSLFMIHSTQPANMIKEIS